MGVQGSQPHISLECLYPNSSFFATNILGEIIPLHLWRRNPLFELLALVPSAVLPTESLLKRLGWGER